MMVCIAFFLLDVESTTTFAVVVFDQDMCAHQHLSSMRAFSRYFFFPEEKNRMHVNHCHPKNLISPVNFVLLYLHGCVYSDKKVHMAN